MMYKSLPSAFLFQALVGVLCVVSISLSGPAWFVTLAILGLRPFLLKKTAIPPGNDIWQLYYIIGKVSIVATAITIIFMYGVFYLFLHSSPIQEFWLLLIPPYFIFIHGIVGLMHTVKKPPS